MISVEVCFLKIQNCMMQLKTVYPEYYSGWKNSTRLLLEIFTNKGIGTAIKNDVEERYYHGE